MLISIHPPPRHHQSRLQVPLPLSFPQDFLTLHIQRLQHQPSPTYPPNLHAKAIPSYNPLYGFPSNQNISIAYPLTTFQLIFFGANDACLPTSSTGQHVPLPIFYNNLKSTILHPSVRSHTHPEYPFLDRQPTKLILVTPPPIDEYQLEDTNPERQRTAEHTKKYADACLELGKEMGVECLNLWGLIMEKAGWKGEGETLVGCKERERSEVLEKLLKDGGLLDISIIER